MEGLRRRGREAAQGCADRRRPRLHKCEWLPRASCCVRAHGWHVASAGEVAQEYGMRLSEGILSGRYCNRGCHFSSTHGWFAWCALCNAGTWSSWREVRYGDETMLWRICDDSPCDVGPGLHWHGQCVTRAQSGQSSQFGSPTSSVIQTSEYEQQSAATSKWQGELRSRVHHRQRARCGPDPSAFRYRHEAPDVMLHLGRRR